MPVRGARGRRGVSRASRLPCTYSSSANQILVSYFLSETSSLFSHRFSSPLPTCTGHCGNPFHCLITKLSTVIKTSVMSLSRTFQSALWKKNSVFFIISAELDRIRNAIILNPLKPELNPICYLLTLLAHHFPHVSRIRVKSLTFR